jgi:hypothetical protein
MKRALALLVAMGVVALASPQEADAQFHRGGSGFAISIGNGFGPGFGPGFGGFGPSYGFNRGFGGFNNSFYRPSGFNVGYSSFRPSYSYGRSFYGGGGYRGGRSCGY